MKTCPKCKTEKEFDAFNKNSSRKDGLNCYCRDCDKKAHQDNKEVRNAKSREYREKHRERCKETCRNYHKKNKEALSNKKREYISKNKEVVAARKRAYYDRTRDQLKLKQEQNKEKIKEYDRLRYIANREKILAQKKYLTEDNKKKRCEYIRKKRETDPQFKLTLSLRGRIRSAIKNGQRAGSAVRDLGCTVEELKTYIESKFQEGMSWDNWGSRGWHLDHIIPVSKFDLTDKEQFLKACHYTNLQPLWAVDNLRKGNRV